MSDFPLAEEIRTVVGMKPRQWVRQFLTLGIVLASALMMWKSMMLVVNSESPIVVVLSGSMEPGYYRSDMLVLTLLSDPITPGDISVFKQDGRAIPIVHRIMKVHEANNATGELYIRTKGDNNEQDDRVLYEDGRLWIHNQNIMGRSKFYLPFVGRLTILVSENPWMKYMVLGMMAFFVLTGKEE